VAIADAMHGDTDRLAHGVAPVAGVPVPCAWSPHGDGGVDGRLPDVGDFPLHVTGTATCSVVGAAGIVEVSYKVTTRLAGRAVHRRPIGEHVAPDADRGTQNRAALGEKRRLRRCATAGAVRARRPI
jgi:hypothetical protein